MVQLQPEVVQHHPHIFSTLASIFVGIALLIGALAIYSAVRAPGGDATIVSSTAETAGDASRWFSGVGRPDSDVLPPPPPKSFITATGTFISTPRAATSTSAARTAGAPSRSA